jgi:hypothetical protein
VATGAGCARRCWSNGSGFGELAVQPVDDRTRCCPTWCWSDDSTAVDVIGRGVATTLTSRLGLRPLAEQLDVPHTTVRSWLERFSDRSPILLAQCTPLAVAMDGTAVDVTTGAARERAALDVLSVVWQRAVARFGERIGSPWSFWSRISGGQALGTHTTSPWAPAAGADWMAPSPLGGLAP